MQFHKALRARPREQVKAIDVLRDDHPNSARSLQSNDGAMDVVRPSIPE
jgi:hypothetical protein